MGLLVDGVWQDKWYDTAETRGRFERQPASIRNWVTADGAAGPSGDGGFKAEPGRYHLYVSLACPWASRTLVLRVLKSLEAAISLSVTSWHMSKVGWTFDRATGSSGDAVNGADKLADIYLKHDPHFTGRVTVPVLWDRQRGMIVNNESSEIIRMFNSAFDAFTDRKTDYYPAALRTEIDRVNDLVYSAINNGVYRAGFATTQEAYEEAFTKLFETLDTVEALLGERRYLAGDTMTEADWRLFTTLIRFDAVYNGHFKCNQRRIVDYPNLSNYTRALYQVAGIAQTVDFTHIKNHYYGSHPTINPTGIVPLGPQLDFSAPHNRGG
ncbi:MAG TPA: glutathione S-transferase family protein [Xanthobacteraceae bacterium]|jgi:putative glutathione S-transferase|nr:glutathione S-transferase family protein [Xanthobacteraceae bacterium]